MKVRFFFARFLDSMARSTDASLAWSTDPIFLESQRDYHGDVGFHEVAAMGSFHHQHASVVWVSFELTWRCLVSRKGKTATVHARGSCVSIEVSLSSAPRPPVAHKQSGSVALTSS